MSSEAPATNRITADLLVHFAGLSDAPELEEKNNKTVSVALMRMRSVTPQHERDIIYNELAALHMPALANAFRRQHAVNSAAGQLMTTCSSRPHFIRFAKLAESADLPNVHAQRLLDDIWNGSIASFEEELQQSLQLLSTFLLVWETELDQDTTRQLVQKLSEWRRNNGRHPDVRKYAERCLEMLHPVGIEGADMHDRQLPAMRKMLARGLDSCYFPGCDMTSSREGPLKACSICKIKYCSVEHQRADWKAHKPFCIIPVF